MAETKFSTPEAIKFGWEVFTQNAKFLIIVTVVVGVIFLILNVVTKGHGMILSALGSLISIVVSSYISMGLIKISLKYYDQQTSEVSDFVESAADFIPFLIASVIYGVAITIGMILLVIPGIYLSIKLFFYGYYIIDQKSEAVDSLKKSYALTDGHFVDLLIFLIALIVINVVGIIPFGLGLLITVPVSMVAAAYVYRRLLAPAEEASAAQPASPEPPASINPA